MNQDAILRNKNITLGIRIYLIIICLSTIMLCNQNNPVETEYIDIILTINGKVMNHDGLLIPGVIVALEKALFKDTTTTDGSFNITGTISILESCQFNDVIVVSDSDYIKYRLKVTKNDTSNIEIRLINCAGNYIDADGNEYQTIQIGKQEWLAENLRTTKYNDGTPIPFVADDTLWHSITTPAYCFYNNTTNTDSIIKFGALYNWYVLNTNKLAQPGWHVPTDAEWDTLQNYLIANQFNWDGSTSGNKIGKSLAIKSDWSESSEIGTIGNNISNNNITGFSAYPCGWLGLCFQSIGRACYWWSITECGTQTFYCRGLFYNSAKLEPASSHERCGISVRLLRN